MCAHIHVILSHGIDGPAIFFCADGGGYLAGCAALAGLLQIMAGSARMGMLIQNFELHIAPLRGISKHKFFKPVAPHWTPEAQAALVDVKNTILSNPCILQFSHRKLILLGTDFSSHGFGYVLC